MKGIFSRTKGIKIYKSYKTYRKFLRVDFHRTCGYCLIPETHLGGVKHFDIDHHNPKTKSPGLLNSYYNLFYCCKTCNSNKSDTWPEPFEQALGARFFDACSDLPNDHFIINSFGELEAISEIGLYTAYHLRLNDPNLDRIRRRIINLAASKFIYIDWNVPIDNIIDLIEP